MNINDIFYIILGIVFLSLIIFGYKMPLDDMDKKIYSEKE